MEVLHCGNEGFRRFCSFDLDLDPMTITYELDLIIRSIYRMCENECRTSTHSKVIAYGCVHLVSYAW